MKASRLSIISLVLVVFILQFSGVAQSALVDNGDGTITQYRDDGSVLMWLQDANMAGQMNWSNAVNWAETLIFAGHDDWRLPTAIPIDGLNYQYDFSFDGSTDYGYNITSPNSELAYMFYVELGNSGYYDISGQENPVYGVTNTSLFENIQSAFYWTGSEYVSDPGDAWGFRFHTGHQGNGVKTVSYNTWAVRTVVPEPISSILFITGGSFLIGRRYIKRKKKA